MNPSFLLLLAIPVCGQLHAAAPDRGFVSRQPAASWEQALVTGNGIQGAMDYGVPNQETIILNHGRLYLPLHPPLPPPDTACRLPELRRLMAAGQFQQAAERVVATADQAGYGGKRWTDPFIPACDLVISQPATGTTTAYQRSVDFTFLIEGPDGKYIFSPSYSPENNPANNPSQACVNATMDVAAARELLTNLVAACQSLGTDDEAVKRWRTMLAKLHGRLAHQ